MRFKLDENLPTSLAKALVEVGHDADTVHDEHLTGSDDPTIADAARANGRFLITQDIGFADLRKLVGGSMPGMMLLRLRDPGRVAIVERVRTVVTAHDVDTWQGCLVVVSDRKVRRQEAEHRARIAEGSAWSSSPTAKSGFASPESVSSV